MKKPILTKEESELYTVIITRGTMDDMFEFAYSIGRVRALEELEKKNELSKIVSLLAY